VPTSSNFLRETGWPTARNSTPSNRAPPGTLKDGAGSLVGTIFGLASLEAHIWIKIWIYMDKHMDLYGFIWIYMGLYGFIWVYMDLYGFIWIYMDLYGFIWIYMDLYG
jgi:hypothetical protein